MDEMILWMARESPFSEFVLNKDDEESLLSSGIILLCGPTALPEAQAMWVCKVLRYSIEGDHALDTWLTLKKGGVSPLLATFVCSHVRTLKGATFSYTGPDGHSSVFYEGRDASADLSAIMRGKPNDPAIQTYFVFGKQKKAGESYESKVADFCKPFIKDDGWGGKISGKGCEGAELVERVLCWQKELEGSLKYPTSSVPVLPGRDTVYLDLDM